MICRPIKVWKMRKNAHIKKSLCISDNPGNSEQKKGIHSGTPKSAEMRNIKKSYPDIPDTLKKTRAVRKPKISESLKRSEMTQNVTHKKEPPNLRKPEFGGRVVELSTTFYHGRGREAMTNEQLVALIQNGDREGLTDLWRQVRRLVLKYARRWAGLGGTSLEDLEQAGAIAVLRAAESYDPTAGMRFTSYLDYFLKQEFTTATGQQTQRQKRDPLQTATSIDTPLAGEGEDAFTLADTLPDPEAEAAILEVAEQDFAACRCAAVEEAINSLPEAEQTAIRRKYYHDEIPDVFAHAKALRMLRHPSRSRSLMAYW